MRGLLLVILLFLALASQAEDKVKLLDPQLLREALGDNVKLSFEAEPLPHMRIFKEQSSSEEPDAYLFNSGDLNLSKKGYRDKVDCFVVISPDGTVLSVIVGDNKESPKYLKRILDSKMLKEWRGKKLNDPSPDTISGATLTSAAINSAVEAVLNRLTEIKFLK